MARYRNIGGPHRRRDGTRVQHGEIFEPDERELRAFGDKFERIHADEEVAPAAAPESPQEAPEPETVEEAPAPIAEEAEDSAEAPEDDEAETEEQDEESASPDWPLKMDPESYLELYPEGPNASLAREILGLED